jgi:cation transport ATPase
MTLLSALLTIPVLILAWALLPGHKILYGAISLGLTTIVQIVITGLFYSGALKALIFSRMIEMDLLIVLSTTTAFVYSVIAYAYLAQDSRYRLESSLKPASYSLRSSWLDVLSALLPGRELSSRSLLSRCRSQPRFS